MTYETWAAGKTQAGWVCLGRYEHTVKIDSTPVLFLWHHPQEKSDITVLVSTDDLGKPLEIIRMFSHV